MAQDSTFVIPEFTNPSGEIVFRLFGWLDGKRIRKNFPTRAEAVAERQALEISLVQAQSSVRTAITRLTDSQLHDAEVAFSRLGNAPKSLAFYGEYALANYRAPEREITVETAATTYLATKQTAYGRGLVSGCQLKDIRIRLVTLKKAFPGKVLSQLTREALAAHCQQGNPKPKTFNNRRGVLFTFFKFAFYQDWVAANPLDKVPHLRIAYRRGSAKTLTAEQAEKLMRHIETFEGGVFVTYFSLCLFAGIRPSILVGEISKLQPDSINLDTGVIHIEHEVSKVRMKRNVTILPNLDAWLRAYALLAAGYLDRDASRYVSPGYAVRRADTFRVNAAFPRVIEASLPLGVGSVSYDLSLAACAVFAVAPADLQTVLSSTFEPATGTPKLSEEAFTDFAIERLVERNEALDHELCPDQWPARGAKNPAAQVSAWHLSDDGARLDLFITEYRDEDTPPVVARAEADQLFKKLRGLLPPLTA